MSTVIEGAAQGNQVWKKENPQSGSTGRQAKAEKYRERYSVPGDFPEDFVEIRNPLRSLIETNRESAKVNVEDLDEARRLVREVAGLMNSEGGEGSWEQVYNLDREVFINLLV